MLLSAASLLELNGALARPNYEAVNGFCTVRLTSSPDGTYVVDTYSTTARIDLSIKQNKCTMMHFAFTELLPRNRQGLTTVEWRSTQWDWSEDGCLLPAWLLPIGSYL